MTIVVIVFAIVLALAGVFSAYFGAGKSRAYGGALLIIGLAVLAAWVYLVGFSDVEPFCCVAGWDVMREALINTAGVVVGALVAIGIFLVVVLKS
ncbi:MAG: hypothetical protein LBG62_03360 [Candidatus Methanoplasma sp.]|nr:hypothetical protein [Candidatus Methanoplasma sp.]